MKYIIALLVGIFSLLGCNSTSGEDVYTFKAVRMHSDYYAEWGERDGQEFEDRYDGLEYEIYDGNRKMGNIVVFQHWFKKGRKEYHKIGEMVKVRKFDYRINRLGAPGDPYTIEYDEFKKLIQK